MTISDERLLVLYRHYGSGIHTDVWPQSIHHELAEIIHELRERRLKDSPSKHAFLEGCSDEMRAYLIRSRRLLGPVKEWPKDYVASVVADLACDVGTIEYLNVSLDRDVLEALRQNNKHALSVNVAKVIAREFQHPLTTLVERIYAAARK